MNMTKSLVALCLVAIMAASASAAELYSEAFNTLAADVTVIQQPDSTVDYVDYSSFSVGNLNFAIPESPRMIAGSSDTRGVLIRANKGDDVEAGSAVNIIAGNAPIAFSGEYILSYDMYMNVPVFDRPTGMQGIPANGSTELSLWGVGAGDSVPNGRNTRFDGSTASGWREDGTYGFLDQENGFGTEDAAIYGNSGAGYNELCDLGDTQFNNDCWPSGGQAEPFNMAFDAPITPTAPNNAAGNQWVEVDVVVQGGSVSVSYNGVEFFNEISTETDGFAFLGYEDPFGSITSDDDFADAADGMWALFDNFVISEVPEPSSALLALFGFGLALMSQRRR